MPGSLGRVDKNKGVWVLGANGFDGMLDVLDGAKNIRSVGEGDEDGMLSDGVGDCLRLDQALGIAGNNGQVDEVVRCVAVECTEDGIVLDGSGDDMEPGLVGARLHGTAEHAVDGEVECIGASMREDDAFWGWCMDEVGEFFACVFEDLGRFSRKCVPASPRVASFGCKKINHCSPDGLGFGPTRCSVIQINDLVSHTRRVYPIDAVLSDQYRQD